MARILPDDLVPEFLDAYGVTELDEACAADQLTVKLWDKYGKTPEAGAETAIGSYVAAIVLCDDCSMGVEVHRARLEAVKE